MPALNHASAYSYRIPAIISAVLVLIAALAVFLWAFVKQGNGGPLFSNPECVRASIALAVYVNILSLELCMGPATFKALS
jgi:hypothetical protein